jgi:hypothetical protein
MDCGVRWPSPPPSPASGRGSQTRAPFLFLSRGAPANGRGVSSPALHSSPSPAGRERVGVRVGAPAGHPSHSGAKPLGACSTVSICISKLKKRLRPRDLAV